MDINYIKSMKQINNPVELLKVIAEAINNNESGPLHIRMSSGEDQDCSFESALKPGNIAIMKQGETKMCGIILPNQTMIKVSADGKVTGYMNQFTANSPLVIEAIYRPTKEHYALHDYRNMHLVWKRSAEKVKKSIKEIEEALGLTPGSLEIN